MNLRFQGMHHLQMNHFPITNKPFERLAKRADDIRAQANITVEGERNGGGFRAIMLTDDDARGFLKDTYGPAMPEAEAMKRAQAEREKASKTRSNDFFYKLEAYVNTHTADPAATVETFKNEPCDVQPCDNDL
jgi:hypothetical protein